MNEGNSNLTETSARHQATGRKNLAFSAWVFTKRVLALGAVVVTVYVTVGSALFPDWWFYFLWGGKFNWNYVASGLSVLVDDYFWLVIGIVLVACGAFVLASFFKTRLFRFV